MMIISEQAATVAAADDDDVCIYVGVRFGQHVIVCVQQEKHDFWADDRHTQMRTTDDFPIFRIFWGEQTQGARAPAARECYFFTPHTQTSKRRMKKKSDETFHTSRARTHKWFYDEIEKFEVYCKWLGGAVCSKNLQCGCVLLMNFSLLLKYIKLKEYIIRK